MYVFTVAQGEEAVGHMEMDSAINPTFVCFRQNDWARVGHCIEVKSQSSGITLAAEGSRTILCAWQWYESHIQSRLYNRKT